MFCCHAGQVRDLRLGLRVPIVQRLSFTVVSSLQGGADPSEWGAAALQGPLMPAQQQRVLAALGEAPGADLDGLGLAPAALGRLVEHNPSIAIEVGPLPGRLAVQG